MRTAPLNLYANDRHPCDDVRILLAKIPAPLHGLFSLTVEHGKAIKLEMQPNPVIHAMAELKGNRTTDHNGFVRSYKGNELRALIDATDNNATVPTESVAMSVYVDREPAEKYYAEDYHYADKKFLGSFTLSTLLEPDAATQYGLPALSGNELGLLKAIAEKIPASLQGAFTVNLVSNANGDNVVVDRLMLAPNAVMQMFTESFLAPVAKQRVGNDPEPPSNMDVLSMRHHTSALEMGRHELETVIGGAGQSRGTTFKR
ncbi:MAG: hypothetical protein J0M34_04340 [Alphaproteobacteria bacterium]|nr:hypothetical protein [Alphaproteobacteria bacterium]